MKNHNVIDAELWYPRTENQPNTVQVALIDVRAADDLRISYDFDRDGWSVQQAAVFEWNTGDTECDSDWQEVAFIQAWASQRVPAPDSE